MIVRNLESFSGLAAETERLDALAAGLHSSRYLCVLCHLHHHHWLCTEVSNTAVQAILGHRPHSADDALPLATAQLQACVLYSPERIAIRLSKQICKLKLHPARTQGKSPQKSALSHARQFIVTDDTMMLMHSSIP